jgi:hypothetical protein
MSGLSQASEYPLDWAFVVERVRESNPHYQLGKSQSRSAAYLQTHYPAAPGSSDRE